MLKIFVGFDRRETAAYQVCVRSMMAHASQPLAIVPIVEAHVRALGILTRPFERRGDRLFDVRSDLPMSTEFSLSRFAVPQLARRGWALFCDCDFLWRADVAEIFALADPHYAVMVVKHDHRPAAGDKMDGQAQRRYARKNWSSLALWNCSHPAHRALFDGAPGERLIDTLHRDDLHAFAWLHDDQIGALGEGWNWLAGHSSSAINPRAVHFTEGTPDMPIAMPPAARQYVQEWRGTLEAITGRAA